jgi:predicted dehydrogenase
MFPHRLHPLLLAIGPEFPKKVACLGTMSIQSDREVPDTTHVMVEFPSGHTVIVAGSTANEQGLQDVIRGHHATMYLGGSRIDVKPERPYSDEMEAASVETGGPSESLEEHQGDFLSCIRTGKIPTCGLELGVKVQAIISLAEMAYRQGKTVSFDTEKLEVV